MEDIFCVPRCQIRFRIWPRIRFEPDRPATWLNFLPSFPERSPQKLSCCRKARSDMLSGQVTLCHYPVQKRPNTLFQNLNSINADACNTNYDSTPTYGSYGEGNGPLKFCRVNLLCSLVRSNKGFASKIQSTTNLITKFLHPTSLTRSKSLSIHKPTKRCRNTLATATPAFHLPLGLPGY